MNKTKLSLIGFLQALGMVVYCGLVAAFFWSAEEFFSGPPCFLNIALILVLLVFSAGVTGSLVFGYSAYLALNQRLKEALMLVVYTLLYCLALFGIIIIVLTILE